MDNRWSLLDTADANDSVINTTSGRPQVRALMDVLLKFNLSRPMIVSFLFPQSPLGLLFTQIINFYDFILFYSHSQTVP